MVTPYPPIPLRFQGLSHQGCSVQHFFPGNQPPMEAGLVRLKGAKWKSAESQQSLWEAAVYIYIPIAIHIHIVHNIYIYIYIHTLHNLHIYIYISNKGLAITKKRPFCSSSMSNLSIPWISQVMAHIMDIVIFWYSIFHIYIYICYIYIYIYMCVCILILIYS